MTFYTVIGIVLIIAFMVLIFLAFHASLHRKIRGRFIASIYILAFLYICAQGLFYAHALPDSSPDEMAHISYIYHVRTTHEIIPHFENMHLFSSQPMKWSVDNYEYNSTLINYLCHPSIYYHIMQLAGGFEEVEPGVVVSIDMFRLRYFSMGIAAIGIALMLYIGWSRIDRSKPWLHLIYATTVTCIPILCLEMCGVSNDAFALITSCICAIGLIRFCEGNRTQLTYILIALGITLSFLNKMTTAMLCALMAIIVLVATIVKEKDFRLSLKKEFWITAPLYVLPVIYIVVIYQRYGVLQPTLKVISPTEYFQNSFFYVAEDERPDVGALSYIANYFNNFFISWSGLVTGDLSLRKSSPWTVSTLPMELLWILPVFAFAKEFKRVAGKLTLPIKAGWISAILTFSLQLKKAYGNWVNNGYTGGSQARYYLPMLFVFALAVVFILDGLLKKNGYDPTTSTTTISDVDEYRKKIVYNHLIYFGGLLYALLLFYGNFPFFLLHN